MKKFALAALLCLAAFVGSASAHGGVRVGVGAFGAYGAYGAPVAVASPYVGGVGAFGVSPYGVGVPFARTVVIRRGLFGFRRQVIVNRFGAFGTVGVRPVFANVGGVFVRVR